MANLEKSVQEHYAQPDLYQKIVTKLAEAGVREAGIKPEHLKSVDEFHIGGAAATEALLDPLGFGDQTRILDIGSGIGGSARFMEGRYGAKVTGVDLTDDYVTCANALTNAVDMSSFFQMGSALDLPFDADSFDAATLIHVGMNLPTKDRLFSEAYRVLVKGGVFAVYDVMLFGAVPDFPEPWASSLDESYLQEPKVYLDAAENAGFTLESRQDRGEMAKAFFAEMKAKMAQSGPPPIGLPLLMGATAPQKAANMVKAVQAGDIQPVEMIFRKG